MATLERTKNATRNIFFGMILKTYQILVPFFMRTAIIYFLGVQYLGLNSLFTSVIQILSLAELGVGSAMVYSMYKPIAEDDHKTICTLLNIYKIYYRIIGGIIGIIGLIITPFIPKLINGDVPDDINIYIIYLMNLGVTVLSYWLFAYKSSILQAEQRNDIISRITLIISTVQYVLQLIVLLIFRNYYYYLIVVLLTQAIFNIVTSVCVDILYPDFKAEGSMDKAEIKKLNGRIRDLFTAKLGNVIISSVDTIVISAFLGLRILAIYQNYYFILNAVCGFLTIILISITAGIGNSLITESVEKNYRDFKIVSFSINFIVCVCCCCFAGLYQPFMKLWVGKKLMLDFLNVVLFCIFFYCHEMSMVWATIKDAAGLWHSDRFRPLIGAVCNLVLNIILVQIIGLYGIMLSTIISYVFISMPWLVHNVFKLIYKKSPSRYIVDLLIHTVVTIVAVILCILSCEFVNLDNIDGFIVKIFLCIFIPVILETIIFIKKEEFRMAGNYLKRMIRSIL